MPTTKNMEQLKRYIHLSRLTPTNSYEPRPRRRKRQHAYLVYGKARSGQVVRNCLGVIERSEGNGGVWVAKAIGSGTEFTKRPVSHGLTQADAVRGLVAYLRTTDYGMNLLHKSEAGWLR